MTPDPITTAREALDKAYEVCRNLGGTDESDFHAIATVFDLVEKLKAERDEAQLGLEAWRGKAVDARTKNRELTSQLEQAERVIAPFAKALKTIPHEGLPDDWRAWQTIELSHLRAASQWIKDRQAKGEG